MSDYPEMCPVCHKADADLCFCSKAAQDAAWNRRAQPAAPAILMSAVFVKEGADDFAPQRLLPCGSAVYLAPPDAAPSVAPEPRTALQRFDEFGGRDYCSPIEQLRFFCWLAMNGQDWLDVEAFFDALAAHPPRAPLTEFRRMQIIGDEFPLALVDPLVIAKVEAVCVAIEAAHGIGGK